MCGSTGSGLLMQKAFLGDQKGWVEKMPEVLPLLESVVQPVQAFTSACLTA